MPTISRLAPTPSGFLHIGNALNFILTWVLTRKAGGELWLRIDDLDEIRSRTAYIEDIFRTLDWLGIDWDKGPFSVGEHIQSHRQSQRIERYLTAIGKLNQNSHTFACDCSRKMILAAHPQGLYTGVCYEKGLTYAQGHTSFRMKTMYAQLVTWQDGWQGKRSVNLHAQMRDFVIRRKDGIPAYQIASLVDDLEMGVNLIVRGKDLILSTAAQLFLADQLRTPSFAQIDFYHHPLLTDAQGKKLSKSEGALSLRYWQKERNVQDLFRFLSQCIGLEEKAEDLKSFAKLWGENRNLPPQFTMPFSFK
ncbi:MAG: glutamate--tRNA ligase family protein [Bacteroidota bacterium]